MLKQKEGYLFDSDDKYFHFLSLNWLDAENEQGSKTYKENICFGDYSEDFLDSLYGYFVWIRLFHASLPCLTWLMHWPRCSDSTSCLGHPCVHLSRPLESSLRNDSSR